MTFVLGKPTLARPVVAFRGDARTVHLPHDVSFDRETVKAAWLFVSIRAEYDASVVLGAVAFAIRSVHVVNIKIRNYNVPARAEVVQKYVDAASIGWPLAKIRHLFGRIGQFLNLTTWYVMKNRSGVVQTVRELKNASPGPLHAVRASYQFHSSKIECLDGSGGLIRDHSDVTNSTVTYAFASVVAET